MVSEKEVFSITGPTFLTAVDWTNPRHRRSIAASLVQGVYTHEHDRRKNRQGPHALAPRWWEFFNFSLIQVLVDNHDSSYFGAIYEFNFTNHNYSGQRPPQYVIAFRGTIKKPGNIIQDFKLNLRCAFNKLQNSCRLQIGLKSVQDIVHKVGPGNVWLAGHSLGSSIALVVGRDMVKDTRVHLETYLFNPPFPSPPIGRIKSDKLKFGIRFLNSAATAVLALAVHDGGQETDPFMVLSSWIPYLFLNPLDPICSEYVGYFEHREHMESIGAGKIARIATKHSIGSILLGSRGGKDCEAVHLIPSGNLTINSTPSQSFEEAHGIDQWWRHDLQFEYKLYQYK